MIYFATDGNYGDSSGLVTLDETMISQELWDLIDIARDNDRYEIARSILLNDKETLSFIANEYDVFIGELND